MHPVFSHARQTVSRTASRRLTSQSRQSLSNIQQHSPQQQRQETITTTRTTISQPHQPASSQQQPTNSIQSRHNGPKISDTGPLVSSTHARPQQQQQHSTSTVMKAYHNSHSHNNSNTLHTTSSRGLHTFTNTNNNLLPNKITKPISTRHLAHQKTQTKNTTLSRQKNPQIPLLTTQKRHHSEYERPFSLYRGTLDSFLIGSRRNYVRPSVTYAAGLGNTTMRHTRLHPEDYIHSIPAHKAFPQYLKRMAERRPGTIMAIGTLLLASAIWDDYRRTNELYDAAVDSIFALKAKNFLIKQGERIFLETLLIMYHEGIIVPLEQDDEEQGEAAGRFIAEIQGMLAEIERHRDFKLSNIPLNVLEVLQEQKKQSFWFRFQVALARPFADPFHHAYAMNHIDGVESDTPWDIIREQRALIETQEDLFNFESKLDSAGVGALYGLFYPLITRYHHMPTELSIQAVPMSMQHSIRHGHAPMSKLVGRVRDHLKGSVLYDQFQESHRNESHGGNPNDPKEWGLTTRRTLPEYWNSDVEAEIYNSYYLQRASNLIKQCRDVEGKVALTMFGEGSVKDVMMNYLSKAHRVLLDRQFKAQKHNFSPGDSPIFRYYFPRFSLVPYLNSLQYEMSELVLLRQRLMKVGRAVGIDPELEQFSPEVLHLLDPYDTRPKSGLRELTIEKSDGTRVVLNENTTGAHQDREMLRGKGAITDLEKIPTANQQLLSLGQTSTQLLNQVNIDQKNIINGYGDQTLSQGNGGSNNNNETTTIFAPQLLHKVPSNPNDISLYAPGASMTFQSTSTLSDKMVNLNDNSSDFAKVNRHQPQLPIALTPTTSSLYQPVKIHHLIESIQENQFNIKGLNVIVDSLHHAQLSSTPKLYPTLGTHPDPLSQEKYYVRSLFNPIQNAFGINDEEKYIRGLLACIDVTLLRNASEYQRWLHLVPEERETFWDKLQGVVMDYFGKDLIPPLLFSKPSSATRETGYLDRNKLPVHLRVPFDGTWKPYTTIDQYGDGEESSLTDLSGQDHINIGIAHHKPTFYETQVGEESWGEFIYRLMGWDNTSKDVEYSDAELSQIAQDKYGLGKDQVQIGLPTALPFHGDIVMTQSTLRNTASDSPNHNGGNSV